MGFKKPLVFAVILSFTALGWGQPGPIDSTGGFVGTITDSATASPLSGAYVILTYSSGGPRVPIDTFITDASGQYSFSNLRTRVHQYWIAVLKPGYLGPSLSNIDLDSGQINTVDFVLVMADTANSWTIVGNVTADSATGAPLAGTLVEADPGGSGPSYTALTDQGGQYVMYIPAQSRNYDMYVAVEVYQSVGPVAVSVSADSTVQDFTLLPLATGTALALPTRGFYLAPGSPNPFSAAGGTAIAFCLPQSLPVHLAVYGASGRLVKVLVDGNRPAGLHTVNWSGKGQAAGTYYCRLQAGKFNAVQRVLLVR
jgi:hypothetical protein